jgi:hypothetical protein
MPVSAWTLPGPMAPEAGSETPGVQCVLVASCKHPHRKLHTGPHAIVHGPPVGKRPAVRGGSTRCRTEVGDRRQLQVDAAGQWSPRGDVPGHGVQKMLLLSTMMCWCVCVCVCSCACLRKSYNFSSLLTHTPNYNYCLFHLRHFQNNIYKKKNGGIHILRCPDSRRWHRQTITAATVRHFFYCNK